MRCLAITYGTEGDSRPLAALCHALASAGHDVHLLADAATLDAAHALGVPATALAGDIRGALARDGGMRDIHRSLIGIVNAQSTHWLRQAVDIGQGCDVVIVSGLAAFVGLSAAEALGVPAIGAMMVPITPTAAFASPLLPLPLPRVLNRASHAGVNAMVWRVFRSTTQRARAQVGLPPRTAPWRDHPVLYGVSPALLPDTGDWPSQVQACGQWVAPSPAWTPPASLLTFLADGEAPVYVGFGSMAGFDNARIAHALATALDDRRVLFNPGWSGIDAARLPPNIHAIGNVPHDWLLPRTALAIHHGGSGTTHSACRAGVPSVIVPFAGDQFFWARRLRTLGIARHALRGSTLSAGALGRAIAFADSAPARANAALLAERMRHEDGGATAVAAIERIVGGARA